PAVCSRGEHHPRNDRGQSFAGGRGGRRNQLCATLCAYHRTFALRATNEQMKGKKNQLPAGNRRLSTLRQRRQQHLLDVKVRARRASHHRNRRVLVAISKVVLVVGLITAIYFGARAGLDRFFFKNPDYSVSAIAVQTDGTLQRDQ